MKIETVCIKDLKLYNENTRKHSEKNLSAIKKSLTKFGQQKPIVVNKDGEIIAGNGTFLAATSLGWDKINVVRTTLNKIDAKAFSIADNRTAELAEWSNELSKVLADLSTQEYDIDSIGFSQEEVDGFINALQPVDIDELLTEVDVSTALDDPIWLVVRTSAKNKSVINEAKEFLSSRGIQSEVSYG